MAIRNERLCHILDDGSEEELALLLLSSTRPLSANERHHAIEVITPGGKIEFQVSRGARDAETRWRVQFFSLGSHATHKVTP
jgi:hypothetical protein